ncbi:methionyl-tRNA synthetase [Sphingomonas vulcanisoli]|uniref:Methionine--tRNA ligase n=1 Tax=Sphingomonas vulcanisoli TaxID=1658060 RepID=A0ABX0TQW3_9SPHN|nr:methionyl-tRNA synthetase [Sphingomonas vulcanisoli]
MPQPYYITTAISYPNGRPHIGHAYEAIATDAIARYHRLAGRDVYFTTGTDEHGLKMVQAARAQDMTPQALADEMSNIFREMDDALNISYDRFIRTTERDHYIASQAIWRAMQAKGDIYLDRYEGWYSVRDEAYYADDELIGGEGGEKLSPQGTPVEWTVEESWFFRLSAYADKLLAYYEANPDFIRPESRRNEVVRFVEGGLTDLSISRTSFDWGVPVPDAPGHVMYVWVDALTNYLTSAGYPDDPARWPADLHVIGKDIIRFHAVYWPAFLMSAELALPRQVFGHGFLLNRGEKMSKSVGNVADPLALSEAFGVDALRYFLLREVSFGQDGSYSDEAIVTRANADLSNSFGNLAQRTLTQIFKNCEASPPRINGHTEADEALFTLIDTIVRKDMPAAFADLALSQAAEAWMQGVFACNAYIDEQAPWALRKTDFARMETVLATLYICIAQLAVAIQPIIPGSAETLLDRMGIAPELRTFEGIAGHWYSPLAESDFRLAQPTPLFPRLELPAEPA